MAQQVDRFDAHASNGSRFDDRNHLAAAQFSRRENPGAREFVGAECASRIYALKIMRAGVPGPAWDKLLHCDRLQRQPGYFGAPK